VGGRVAPGVFAVGSGQGIAGQRHGAALIDDATPTPPRARFTRARLAHVACICIGLWLAAMGTLAGMQGLDATFTQMGWFFTKRRPC
jgi:chromate transporter